MSLALGLPDDIERWPLPARLRWWANQFGSSEDSRHLASALDEAADEIDMLQQRSTEMP